MLVVNSFKKLPGSLAYPIVAIGVFDGVHAGHRIILETLVKRARLRQGTPLLLTFRPHPQKVISSGDAPLLLQTPRQKRKILADLGIEALIELPFTRRLSLSKPEQFVQQILFSHGIREIHVGRNFRFGHRRSGDFELLDHLANEQGIRVVPTAPVRFRGQRISSTRIRQSLLQGQVSLARHLLGRAYEISGTVVRGGGKGVTLGFPTANLQLENELIPENGVYGTWAKVGGQTVPSVTNIGFRPTISSQQVRRSVVETHLLDFDGDLYGQSIDLQMCFRVRGEKKFENLDKLKQQIKRDVVRAQLHLSDTP